LNNLKKHNKNIYFFTNNSSVSRKSYVEKLTNFGFAPDIDHVFFI
jgi:ribonucleotide monophosphatase NagD (HAD superfamily)